jgi:signal transduction histidine kinase
MGPVEAPQERWLVRIVPPLFYLSIFVLVGLWLRPLLTDINNITTAAQRFAADYREPLATASDTTQLTGLAQNLDDMSGRLSGLIQSQKELIAALSHEMRTPLARIRFALAVMDAKADDNLAARIDALNTDVQEIDDLIAAMLEYARLDHPDLQMHWQQVPLEPWLEQIVDKFQHPDRAILLDREIGLDTASMDPRLMTLAVSNLLNNASRYARACVNVRLNRVDNELLLCVEDDGDGVPEDQRESVFKAFKRIDDSRNRETGGYGLGLAVVARIAALHGGSVNVGESKELGGASFVLRWTPP